jgi:hypothetical protein
VYDFCLETDILLPKQTAKLSPSPLAAATKDTQAKDLSVSLVQPVKPLSESATGTTCPTKDNPNRQQDTTVPTNILSSGILVSKERGETVCFVQSFSSASSMHSILFWKSLSNHKNK